MNLIDPTTLRLVERSLDAAALRHAAIAQNVANANVPGAKRMQVSFEGLLSAVRNDLLQGRAVAASDIPQATVSEAPGGQEAIELDKEMAAMSSNSLHYQALVRALNRHLGMLSMAVQDGKR
jgi:flagellar basal-body rod protein FlgB